MVVRRRTLVIGTVLGLVAGGSLRADDPIGSDSQLVLTPSKQITIAGDPSGGASGTTDEETNSDVLQAQDTQQPALQPAPQTFAPATNSPAAMSPLAAAVFGSGSPSTSLLSQERRRRASGTGSDFVLGGESGFRATTDAGSLLGKSSQTRGVAAQNRSPIITDTRVRGSGVGSLLASGSYWVPARMDLDTVLSKIDSRIIGDLIVVKGPYSSLYGPGTQFIDVNLLESPRFANGPETHLDTVLEYKTNGEQLYGRETIRGGDANWGYRVGYGHRTGNDYTMGNGDELPTSYKSRDIDVAIGWDPSEDEHVEINYIRLDQTDVEIPGQFFDFNFLKTDATEIKYSLANQPCFDLFTFETWYNRTVIEADATRTGKNRQIPSIRLVTDSLFTDIDSMSTGYSSAVTWGQRECPQLTVGSDLRYVKQEHNETNDFSVIVDQALSDQLGLTDGMGNPLDCDPPCAFTFFGTNTPIPRSHWSNPGLFSELKIPASDNLKIQLGARVDWLGTNIEKLPDGLSPTLPAELPFTRGFVQQYLHAKNFDKDFGLWALYATAENKLDEHWTVGAAAGHSTRPPTLTELYSLGPYNALVQNGFNAVVGDPNLDVARYTQIDLSLKAEFEKFRGGVTGFYAWVEDYITLEVVLFNALPGTEEARIFRPKNTPLATLSGFETYAEYDCSKCLTAFGTMSFVEGRDHSRNSGGMDFFNPAFGVTTHDPNSPRGLLPGSDEEPLPMISPLETRVGVRIHEPVERPRYGAEFAARIVDNQDRVATSLGELATPGYTTYDIRGYWRACDNLTLISGVENLTDKFYQEHLDLRTGRGVFQPGINFYFVAELTF